VVGSAAPGLARLLPELSADPAAQIPADGIQSAQLLELVLGLLGRLSAARPVMLVLEDLHWADQSTLELVAFLVPRACARTGSCWWPPTGPTSCTGVTRCGRCSPAGSGSGPSTGVELLRFQRDEVATQLEAILAAEPRPGLLDLVFDRSGGNAYLVEELAGVVRRGRRPGGPAAVPGRRPAERRGLAERGRAAAAPHAAVAGKRVPDRLLAEVAGLDEAELFAVLREALESHLLVVDRSGHGYEFRHALNPRRCL